MNKLGMPLYNAQANQGYVDTLRKELSPDAVLAEVDYHINDLECAAATVDLFMKLWDRQ